MREQVYVVQLKTLLIEEKAINSHENNKFSDRLWGVRLELIKKLIDYLTEN